MKTTGLIALLLILGIQVVVFGVQTYFATQQEGQEQMRAPSSIPVHDFKYKTLPDDFPWNDNVAYKN